jgi:hypothetical protein
VRRRAPEQALQRAVAELLNFTLGGLAWWTHFPAGGGGTLRGKILKGLGLKPGVPDILIIDAGRAYWLELKAPRGWLNLVQRSCHVDLLHAGCPVAVIKSVDQVLPQLMHWGIALKPGVRLAEPAA